MKKCYSLITILFTLLTVPAYGDINSQRSLEASIADLCADQVRDCFVSEGLTRMNCFFSAATHPSCEGSSLGKLIYKRWSFSPIPAAAGDAPPPAFLGPQVVDQECLTNFDNRSSALIIGGAPREVDIHQLDEALEKCKVTDPGTMLRP